MCVMFSLMLKQSTIYCCSFQNEWHYSFLISFTRFLIRVSSIQYLRFVFPCNRFYKRPKRMRATHICLLHLTWPERSVLERTFEEEEKGKANVLKPHAHVCNRSAAHLSNYYAYAWLKRSEKNLFDSICRQSQSICSLFNIYFSLVVVSFSSFVQRYGLARQLT